MKSNVFLVIHYPVPPVSAIVVVVIVIYWPTRSCPSCSSRLSTATRPRWMWLGVLRDGI
jgi:hypothetical protein